MYVPYFAYVDTTLRGRVHVLACVRIPDTRKHLTSPDCQEAFWDRSELQRGHRFI